MKTAFEIINHLNSIGHIAYIAGGACRDMLLKREPSDWDIATSASPDAIESIISSLGYKYLSVGKQFGVIVAVTPTGEYEIATFRKDGKYSDGRRPDDIQFSTPIEDAKRRDFTINGMFFDGVEIIDHVNGMEDLDNKIIRSIGNPDDRFNEDKLRMLRAVRFACQLGFTIEESTLNSIQRHSEDILQVSYERIFKELNKIMESNPARGLVLLRDSCLLQHILPEVEEFIDLEQYSVFHPEGSVWNHVMGMLKHSKGKLAWACLFHDIGKITANTHDGHFYGHAKAGVPIAEAILRRLKAPNELIDYVKYMVEKHMLRQLLNCKKSTLKKYMAHPYWADLLALHRLDCISSNGDIHSWGMLKDRATFIIENEEVKPKRLITGKDLIAMGVEPGKEMGKLLTDLYNRQLDGEFTIKEEGINLVYYRKEE